MSDIFSHIEAIQYAGVNSDNPLSYRYYQPEKVIFGKTMEEHLRISICYWHNFVWNGFDIFGEGTFNHPWLQDSNSMESSEIKVDAIFELLTKLNLKYFTFHDRDIAPVGRNFKEEIDNVKRMAEKIAAKMETTKKELLWGTANLTSHKRYMAGAASNPNPEIFAYAVAQVKNTLDMTHQLQGHNYVFWGGREGYDTLLNTDLRKELDQLGRFFSMIVDYKNKIGFKGALLIEPKPCEPSKHQYDFDTATVYAFLQKYGLEKEFKVNIEANHATLAGHSFQHEVAYTLANGIFGSIDANQGDAQLGWDTDQFPLNTSDYTHVMYLILQNGGFTTGGLNLDTKLRRQSTELVDYFYAHISAVDNLAHCLLNAVRLIEQGKLSKMTTERYQGWGSEKGQRILNGGETVESLAKYVLDSNFNPEPVSAHQELLEMMLNNAL
ncbi:MAG: xylose isomerase [Legionellales bacterium]